MTSYLILGDTEQTRVHARNLALEFLETKQFPHPDLLILAAETGDLKNFGIAAIRNLERQINLKPYQALYQVAIIYDSHLLSPEAQNALLKTLEEPPGKTIIILTAPRQQLLPNTIESRCQVINLRASKQWQSQSQIISQVEQIVQTKPLERLPMATNIAKTSHDAKIWLEEQLILWRQVLILPKTGRPLLKFLAFSQIDERTVSKFLRFLLLSLRLLDRHIAIKMTIEQVLLRMPHIKG